MKSVKGERANLVIITYSYLMILMKKFQRNVQILSFRKFNIAHQTMNLIFAMCVEIINHY